MAFEELIGNRAAKERLLQMFETKKIPGTLLLEGPSGVGKTLFALEFATMLIGKNTKKNHADIHHYRPEGKSGMHSMASMQELIKEVSLPPFESPYKVCIIHEAERMLVTSSNALLKTLEEPPLNSVIILLSSEPKQLLPTIFSRCACIRFFPVPENEIASWLISHQSKSAEEASKIALLSEGSLANATRLASKPKEWQAFLVTLLSTKSQEDRSFALSQLEASFSALKEEQEDKESSLEWIQEVDVLFEHILLWYRDLHLLKENIPSSALFYEEHKEDLKKISLSSLPPLEKIVTLIQECREAVQSFMKLKNILEYFILKAF